MELYIGTIVLWPITYAPEYFMFCQGQTLAVNQYQAVFSLLSARFGGNGTTNFSLPDFRGRIPIGTGTAPDLPTVVLAQKQGSLTTPAENTYIPAALSVSLTNAQASGSFVITANQLPAHTHDVNAEVISINIPANSGTPGTDTTNVPTGNILAQGTATVLANNQAKVYTADAANTSLKAFNITIPASTTTAVGAGQAITVNSKVVGQGMASGVVTIPKYSFPNMQPSLGIGYIIAIQGIYPVNPN